MSGGNTIIIRSYKFRLYPNRKQKGIINFTLDLCRKQYNNILNEKIETYRHTGISLSKIDLNSDLSYYKEQYPELKTIHSQVLQNINDRVHKAFNNMFFRIKKGKKAGFPRFKSKNRYKSITYPQSGFCLNDKKLKISKIGEIRIKKHRKPIGKIKTLTIQKTSTDKYYATFSCVTKKQAQDSKLKGLIGIDIGLTSFVTTSDGKHFDNPRYFKRTETHLASAQRRLSRKKKLSKNRKKQSLKVALVYEKISNQRADFCHKLSHHFTTHYDFIAVEDLHIKKMIRNRHMSKSISDAGWRTFVSQLCYKAESAGGTVQKVDTSFPSSQLCSRCETKTHKTLATRMHKCLGCGLVLDRDENAAKNILQEALRKYTAGTVGINACGDVSLETSSKQEATAIY